VGTPIILINVYFLILMVWVSRFLHTNWDSRKSKQKALHKNEGLSIINLNIREVVQIYSIDRWDELVVILKRWMWYLLKY
jgi:hypothetical protein